MYWPPELRCLSFYRNRSARRVDMGRDEDSDSEEEERRRRKERKKERRHEDVRWRL